MPNVFNVTPEQVIINLLNQLETPITSIPTTKDTTTKDYTTYLFNGEHYKKGKLVLAVITDYVKKHTNITFDELSKVFPKELQGSIGVFNNIDYVQNKYEDKKIKRHFMGDKQTLQLSDSEIVVCTEWGVANIGAFLEKAEKNDITIVEAE